MNDQESASRLDAEWVALNAFRDLVKVAARGDFTKSTYKNAQDLGGALYPELLGPEHSILWRERESDTTGEYRQRAKLRSVREKKAVSALALVKVDIEELEDLLQIAEQSSNKEKVDKLRRKLSILIAVERELSPLEQSENKLIFRDAYNIERDLPTLDSGHGFRDFEIGEDKVLRVRVLHPDRPEHITGVDIVYERHDRGRCMASIVAVQYKIWEDRRLYMSDPRMNKQIDRLSRFICGNGVCSSGGRDDQYRFPHCAAFLRPTDKLQSASQKFISTGEHLPICRLDDCRSRGKHHADVLEYEQMKETSLSGDMFEHLFCRGRIGSRMLTYSELERLYKDNDVLASGERVIVYAQEF